MNNLNNGVSLVNTIDWSAEGTTKKPKENRYTSDRWKLYLDSCTTYHSFFAKELLLNTEYGDTTLTGSYNAGTLATQCHLIAKYNFCSVRYSLNWFGLLIIFKKIKYSH
jgi:hypothetical protein